MHLLFLGDIVGAAGVQAVCDAMEKLCTAHAVDCVVVNGENAASGFGITPQLAKTLFDSGVAVITSGNHIWRKKNIRAYLQKEPRLLRPANYPPGAPGHGSVVVQDCRGVSLGVLNLCGRIFMDPLDCPFQVADREVAELRERVACIVVDMHAEATSEKIALGCFLDGRVSAVLGTHTHVQTADERILPGGTACITDVGMTGATGSVIGIQRERAVERFLSQMPLSMTPAGGEIVINGVCVDIDDSDGTARHIERVVWPC